MENRAPEKIREKGTLPDSGRAVAGAGVPAATGNNKTIIVGGPAGG